MEQNLEKVMKEKIEPILEDAMQKFLGVSIRNLESDITDRLGKPLIEFEVDTSISFKSAKKLFKKLYIKKMLELHYGNVSEVARLSGLNRRSIHRAIRELSVNVEKIRKDFLRAEYYLKEAVDDTIRDALDNYKKIIRKERLDTFYSHVPEVSEIIAKELPIVDVSWKEFERDFEKKYLEKALSENDFDLRKTAKKIKIRYETLLRKIKQLGLKRS